MIGGVPVEPGRAEAGRLAREELAKEIYQAHRPGLVRRLVGWLADKAGQLLDGAAGVSPGGLAGLVVVALLVVATVVAVRLRVGPLGRRSAVDPTLFTGRRRSAADHRAAADGHAARGEWADAVRERLRAVVRSLEERALLDDRPGRTADEAAAEAGLLLPGCADDLRHGARTFDDVWYGGRRAGPEHDAALRTLDDRVRGTRPQPAGPRGSR